MKVNVSFDYEPEPEEVDESDPTGLTSEAYDTLMDTLMEMGATDPQVVKRS